MSFSYIVWFSRGQVWAFRAIDMSFGCFVYVWLYLSLLLGMCFLSLHVLWSLHNLGMSFGLQLSHE